MTRDYCHMENMDELPKIVNGYPKLAARFALVPETAHYRTFAGLAHRDLLYYQAELVQLENILSQLEIADSSSPEGQRSRYARNWAYLDLAFMESHGEQWQVFLKIRKLLPQYCEALSVYPSIVMRLRLHQIRPSEIRCF